MSEEENTQWTIEVSRRRYSSKLYKGSSYGRISIELHKIPIAEYRAKLVPGPETPEEQEDEEAWDEVLASRGIRVGEEGLKPLLALCGENEFFQNEFEDLLEKVWHLGRAFERQESKKKPEVFAV